MSIPKKFLSPTDKEFSQTKTGIFDKTKQSDFEKYYVSSNTESINLSKQNKQYGAFFEKRLLTKIEKDALELQTKDKKAKRGNTQSQPAAERLKMNILLETKKYTDKCQNRGYSNTKEMQKSALSNEDN